MQRNLPIPGEKTSKYSTAGELSILSLPFLPQHDNLPPPLAFRSQNQEEARHMILSPHTVHTSLFSPLRRTVATVALLVLSIEASSSARAPPPLSFPA
jgi:hypothetical protein